MYLNDFFHTLLSVPIPPLKPEPDAYGVDQTEQREGTDNKVWIKSIWCIREKFHLQKVGVTAGCVITMIFSIFHFNPF